MKKTVFFFLAFLFFSLSGYPQYADISVKLTGIMEKKGVLKIGIFNSSASFKTKSNPVAGVTLPCDDSIVCHTFKRVQSDILAIAVFHDENSDDTLNTKKLGIPLEGVGFSGTHTSRLSKPKYEDALFSLSGDTLIEIRLIYPKR